MSAHIEKAVLLIQQSRYELARQQLTLELTRNPNSAEAHSLMALCLVNAKQLRKAVAEAEAGVGLAPDSSYAHYVLASVLQDDGNLKRAESEARDALRIEPDDADYLALLAGILYAKKQFGPALETVGQALAQDPKHVTALNLRSMVLGKLKRTDEAHAAIDAALREDPDNALTHSTRGWTELEHGDHREALDHFREALRLDPELETAREGLLQALKAKSLIYRVMLKYYFAMSRLSGKAQWAVLIGGYFGVKFIRIAAKSDPSLAPFVLPVVILYLAFAFLSWTADPLFNLFLRLHPYGRYALSREQVRATSWVGGSIALALLSFGLWLATRAALPLLTAIFALTMVIPIAATFAIGNRGRRRIIAVSTAVLAALGIAALVLHSFDPGLSYLAGNGYLLGFVVLQFVANGMIMRG